MQFGYLHVVRNSLDIPCVTVSLQEHDQDLKSLHLWKKKSSKFNLDIPVRFYSAFNAFNRLVNS
jgi:hypothetical protein